MPEHWPSPAEFLEAMLVVMVVVAHVAAMGYWGIRALGYRAPTPLLRLVAMAAVGFVGLEFYVFWVGHTPPLDFSIGSHHVGPYYFLSATTFTTSAILCTLSLVPVALKWRNLAHDLRGFVEKLRFEWVLVNSMAILVIFAAISGMRGSQYEDDYKPGAPLAWARAGRFVPTDFRICNGMAASEAIFAVPQTYYKWIDSYQSLEADHGPASPPGQPIPPTLIALHWTHLLTWLLILLAGAALGQAFGAGAIATAAAVAAIPVMTSTAGTAGTDIPCAALLTAAFAVLFSESADHHAGARFSRSSLILAGILLGGAITSKPILAAGAIPMALFVFVESERAARGARAPATSARRQATTLAASLVRPGGGNGTGNGDAAAVGETPAFGRGEPLPQDLVPSRPSTMSTMLAAGNVLRVAAPAMLLVAMWVVHTYAMVGSVWDSSGQYIVTSAHDKNWINGEAAGRKPSIEDIAELPAVPFIATLFGQKEPYGGRIGLLTMSVSLVGIYLLRRMPPEQRRMGYWAVATALIYFFLLGPFGIKTRFHNYVWTVFAALAALAYTQVRGTENRQQPWWHALYWLSAAGIVAYVIVVPPKQQSWAAIASLMGAVMLMVLAHIRGRDKAMSNLTSWKFLVASAFLFLALAGMADSIARKLVLPG
jgi:hypothetical protein